MKINRISLHALHNMRGFEHFQFHTEFKRLISRLGANKLKVGERFEKYLAMYETVDDALGRIIKSQFTRHIKAADKAREEIWRGLVDCNAAFLNHFNPAKREAARRLKIVFDNYGNIARKSQIDQTTAAWNVTQELRGEHSRFVAALGLEDWVGELEARNAAFKELMTKRFEESGERCSTDLKKARSEIDRLYAGIIELISANMLLNRSEIYETFAKSLAAVTEKYAR